MAKRKLIDVRLSFPDLYRPVEYEKDDGKPRFNATFLIDPKSENHKNIEADIVAAAKEVFEKDWEKKLAALKGNSNKYCYLDGNLKDYDGYAGMYYLAAHKPAKQGPVGVYGNVIDPQTGKVVVLTEESGKPYGGCYVNATVEIYAQKGANPGIRCGLIAVQFARDGDAFSGSKPANPDDFAPVEGADADPLA